MTQVNVVRTELNEPNRFVGSTTTKEPSVRLSEFPRARRALEFQAEPRWANEVVARLTHLLTLRPGWDGYQAPSLSRDAAMFALEVLQNIMQPGTPTPFVVPSSIGGIQIEWHQPALDVEIHILGPYQGEYWWGIPGTDKEEEGPLGADLSPLSSVISKLSTAVAR